MFCFSNLWKNSDINFLSGFPNVATFMAPFEFLNPEEDWENIRPCRKHCSGLFPLVGTLAVSSAKSKDREVNVDYVILREVFVLLVKE